MARKKKTVQDVTITGIADRGKAVGRQPDGAVCFVEGAVPGDIVDVLILRKKKSYGQGIVTAFKKYSEDRIKPACDHFGLCGGCKWQNLSYDAQLRHKQQVIIDAMTRIGHLPTSIIKPILGSELTYQYRNKLEYSFSNKRWLTEEEIKSDDEIINEGALGFHRAGAFDKVVKIESCQLQEEFTNTLRNFIRDYCRENNFSYYDIRNHNGLMRNMIFRNNLNGEWMVNIIFGRDDVEKRTLLLDELIRHFPRIKSLHYMINEKKNDSIYDLEAHHYHGDHYLIETLGDRKFQIGPKSFFQTNTTQAKLLYDVATEMAELKPSDNVYDLYTGLGSIAIYIADKCAHVTGIEEVEAAILDAHQNMKLNNIQNATFYAGDVKNILSPEFAQRHGKADVVITDPPRAGMHGEVVQTLLDLAPPRIVYVSCNPSTQARDLALLSEKYETTSIQGVDMFPHTHHVESVALLKLR